MISRRVSMPWVAGFAWGAFLSAFVFLFPPLGIPALVVAIGTGVVQAVRRRRTAVLSGLFVGLGGLWLVYGAIAELGCVRAAQCDRSEIALSLALIASGLVVVGAILFLADRRP